MRKFLIALACFAVPLAAQKVDALDGLWQGYDPEWRHVSTQLLALAETIPAEKYSWRPAPGVRSVSEVIMHAAIANFSLLNATGPALPKDLTSIDLEKSVKEKSDCVSWLRRSLEAVRIARTNLKPGDLNRKVAI